MRCLKRNQSKMYLSNLIDKTPILDEWGNKTGEYELIYDKPQEFYAYVTPEKDWSFARRFGIVTPYDRVLVLDETQPEINEQTRLWIDVKPVVETTDTRVFKNKCIAKRMFRWVLGTPVDDVHTGCKCFGKRMFGWKLGVLNDGFLSWDISPGDFIEKYIEHDYIVKRVSKSLNSRLISIRKVNVDG